MKKKPKKQKQPSPKTNKKTKKGFRMGNRHFPKDINGQMGFLKMFHFCKSCKECQQEPPWISPPERPREIELKPVVFIVSWTATVTAVLGDISALPQLGNVELTYVGPNKSTIKYILKCKDSHRSLYVNIYSSTIHKSQNGNKPMFIN